MLAYVVVYVQQLSATGFSFHKPMLLGMEIWFDYFVNIIHDAALHNLGDNA
jgi:hypothetical protein